MSKWEYRCFVPRAPGFTAVALAAAQLSGAAQPERRTDEYFALDADNGLKLRDSNKQASAKLELKTCQLRLPNGCEQLCRRELKRDTAGWRDATGPLDPALAAVLEAAVTGQPALAVKKQRWAATDPQGVGREVTKLKLGDGGKFLTLSCEGTDAAAVFAAGSALQRAALAAAGLPPEAARVCSYAAWVYEQQARRFAAV